MFQFMKTAGLALLVVAARSMAADVSRYLFWDKDFNGKTRCKGRGDRSHTTGVGCARLSRFCSARGDRGRVAGGNPRVPYTGDTLVVHRGLEGLVRVTNESCSDCG